MDSFMRTKTCCGCIPPKIGILIIAGLAIVLSTSTFINSVMDLSSGHYIPKQSFGMGENFWKSIKILETIMSIVNFILSSLLIMGVTQNKPSLIFPSVCASFIGICFFIPSAFLPFAIVSELGWGLTVTFFIMNLLGLFLYVHWTFVIYHYYKDLVQSQNSEHPPKHIQYNSRRV